MHLQAAVLDKHSPSVFCTYCRATGHSSILLNTARLGHKSRHTGLCVKAVNDRPAQGWVSGDLSQGTADLQVQMVGSISGEQLKLALGAINKVKVRRDNSPDVWDDPKSVS
jgi:hypothetical protein